MGVSDGIDLQGHRGARGLLPENSIPSFQKALELGVQTVELDVVVTADSQVVVSHEPWMSSVICSAPDGEPISEEDERSYNIYEMSYEEVAEFDCGSRGHPLFKTQQAQAMHKPRLDSAIAAMEQYVDVLGRSAPTYNIEIKSQPAYDGTYTPHPETLARLVYDVIAKEQIQERTYVQSFDPRSLVAMREIDPDVPLALLVSNEDGFSENIDRLGFKPAIYSPHHRLVDDSLVTMAHDAGIKVIPWTINEPLEMQRLLELGVDGIITDYPDRAAALLAFEAAASIAKPPPGWYKGNTHVHTVLSGHADSSPEYVARWYLDRGYNFLILSEHNIFINPDSVELPADRRDDFLLIPGEEVTGNQVIHTTAMNIDGLVDWHADHEHKHEIIQSHVDSTVEAGGTPILNHPNFGWAVTTDDMLPVERLHMFELYNGHPHVHVYGDDDRPSTETMWDVLLTEGMLIYAVSSDDAHEFQQWGDSLSNPGRGWVMVKTETLTPDGITQAMRSGDFYATSGVVLDAVNRGPDEYSVTVDEDATRRELASPYLVGHRAGDAREDAPNDAEYEISFIGVGGAVLETVHDVAASYPITTEQPYIRAKITYRRAAGEGGGVEAYYAWTQPVFTDDRAERAAELGNQ